MNNVRMFTITQFSFIMDRLLHILFAFQKHFISVGYMYIKVYYSRIANGKLCYFSNEKKKVGGIFELLRNLLSIKGPSCYYLRNKTTSDADNITESSTRGDSIERSIKYLIRLIPFLSASIDF